MWSPWWNQIRLSWHMKFGKQRKVVSSLVADLLAARTTNHIPPVSASELEFVQHIQNETRRQNQNNLTRTASYLSYYKRNPEIHWALLAHCVSRNGGYAMTDVQGEWFRRTATVEDARRFFEFLERANYLIFSDAYPQLLLYEEGKRTGRSLVHLLPKFHVSRFMIPLWTRFQQTQNSSLLTRALIINEQNYIESRIVQNSTYQATVESSIQFQLQSFLNLNQVLLPYRQGQTVRLAGTTVPEFGSVDERIQTGLRLYEGLFQDRLVHQSILRFMETVHHTGSRADYWPSVFTPNLTSSLSTPYISRFSGTGSQVPIYSPRLVDVWPNVKHQDSELGDWFADFRHTVYLFDDIEKQPKDITEEYVQSIRTIETLIIGKEQWQNIIPGSS